MMSSSESESSSTSDEEPGDVPAPQLPDPSADRETSHPAQASSSNESATSSSEEESEEETEAPGKQEDPSVNKASSSESEDEEVVQATEQQVDPSENKSSSSESEEEEGVNPQVTAGEADEKKSSSSEEEEDETTATKPSNTSGNKSSSSGSEESDSDDEKGAAEKRDVAESVQQKKQQSLLSDSESASDSDGDVRRNQASKSKLVSSDDDSDSPAKSKSETAATKKGVFGSDSDSSSDDDEPDNNKSAKKSTEYDIFGDLGDDMSSEDEGKAEGEKEQKRVIGSDDDEGMENDENADTAEPVQEPVETQIAVDLPHIKVDLGKGIHFVKMPNFLSVETRPFDPQYYEDELIEDDVMDEEGRTRLKLKVENTMRWKIARDSDGNELRDGAGNVMHESNTRIVRWSDGSMSLHLGKEIFDVHVMDTMNDYNHLFIRQGSGLQGQAIFRSKLTFRPHSTDSFTHRKITMSLADKSTKQQKVKVLPMVGKDPEANRDHLIKKEEEKLRASLRRENENRRRRERDTKRAMTDTFLDAENPNDVDDEHTISLSSIKDSVKKKRSVSAIYSSDDSDDDDSNDSLSDTPIRKKARTKVLSDDEEEDSDSGSGSD